MNAVNGAAANAAEALEKVSSEERNVFGPLAQRRRADIETVQYRPKEISRAYACALPADMRFGSYEIIGPLLPPPAAERTRSSG